MNYLLIISAILVLQSSQLNGHALRNPRSSELADGFDPLQILNEIGDFVDSIADNEEASAFITKGVEQLENVRSKDASCDDSNSDNMRLWDLIPLFLRQQVVESIDPSKESYEWKDLSDIQIELNRTKDAGFSQLKAIIGKIPYIRGLKKQVQLIQDALKPINIDFCFSKKAIVDIVENLNRKYLLLALDILSNQENIYEVLIRNGIVQKDDDSGANYSPGPIYGPSGDDQNAYKSPSTETATTTESGISQTTGELNSTPETDRSPNENADGADPLNNDVNGMNSSTRNENSVTTPNFADVTNM